MFFQSPPIFPNPVTVLVIEPKTRHFPEHSHTHPTPNLANKPQYPYALRILPHTLSEQWTDPSFQPYISPFPAAHKSSEAALLQHVTDLTESDIKDPALKKLQGYLWRSGYESGEIRTPVFSDVVPRMREWIEQGKTLVVYSSGSVDAQKLLFGYAGVEGSYDEEKIEDLNSLFVANFDTMSAGPKTEARSYVRIASEMKVFADEVLFLSDNVRGKVTGAFLLPRSKYVTGE
jgi:enolase-phosphatase E1